MPHKKAPYLFAFLFISCGDIFSDFKLPELAIYQVRATSLRVRDKPGEKGKVLFSLPDKFYFLNNPKTQSSLVVGIGEKKGRWLNVTNGYGTVIGYVFEGFTRPTEGLSFEAGCGHTATTIDCGKHQYSFSPQTPLAGSWNKEAQRCDNRGTYVIQYDSRDLFAMSDDSRAVIAFVHKNGRILQFIPHWVGCHDAD